MATVRLQIRRGTASQWTSANPTLAAGEMGVETDTRKVKIGDGTTGWTSLNYIAADNPEISEIAQDAIDAALVAGTGIVKSYNDGANTITVSVDTSVIATKAELAEVAQDSIDQALTAGTGITKNYNDAANTLTVSVDTSVIADRTYADTKLALAGGTMSGAIAMGSNKVTGMADPDNNQDAATKKYVDDEITSLGNNLNNTIGDYIPLSEKGTLGGVATLDADVLVPLSQLTHATDYTDAHEADTTNVHGIADTTVLVTTAGATFTGALTLPADPNSNLQAATKQYVDAAQTSANQYTNAEVTDHNDATTGVHGIANTADLATKAYAEGYTDNQINLVLGAAPASLNTLQELAAALDDDASFASTVTNALALKAPIDAPTFTGEVTGIAKHMVGLANVDNTSDADKPVSTATQAALDLKAPLAAPTFTGNVTLPSSTSIGDVSNLEIGYLNGVTSGIQTQLDSKLDSTAASSTYAPLAAPTFTGNVTLPSSTSIGDVSNLEIGYLNGVTSGIQTQLDSKLDSTAASSTYAPLAAPTFTGNVTLPSSTSIGDVSNLEIGYLNGVTSGIQTQLDDKAPLAAPTFTGSVTLPASTSIGDVSNLEIGYLDGVTSGIQTQLDDKAPLASPTFTGTVILPNGTVTGSMIAATTIATSNIADTAITADKLATNSVTNAKLADDAVDTAEIKDGAVTSAKIADGTIVNADISETAAIDWTKLAVSSTVSATELGYVDGVTSAIQTQLDAKLASATAASTYAPIASPTFTGTVVLPTTTAGGNIVPSVDNTYDLGSLSAMWKDIYVGPGSLYVNGQKVLQDESGNIVVSADANENISIRTSGSGNVELDATGTGNIQIKSAMVIEAGSNITSSDGNAVVFGNAINTDTISSKTTNTDLSLSANGTGKVYLNDNAEVNGNLVVGGNLTVSGTTTTVNSETINLADNIIDLNSNFTSGSPTENAGIKIKRGDSADVQIRWNESADVWEFTNDGTNYSTITPLNSPTFTGTVSGITSTMVGLGNVDNTSDANKPISTATQTSLDLKAPLASPTFTGTVTVSASGVAYTDGTQTKEGVPSRTYIYGAANSNSISSNTTLSTLAYRDSLIECSNATGTDITLTVPTNASAAFPIGTSFDIVRMGASSGSAGAVTIAGASGVTVNATPGLKLRAQYSSATLLKRGTDSWLLLGDLTA